MQVGVLSWFLGATPRIIDSRLRWRLRPIGKRKSVIKEGSSEIMNEGATMSQLDAALRDSSRMA